MGIRDQRVDWIRKRLWLTPFDTQSVGLLAEVDDTLEIFHTADSDYMEINNLGMGFVALAANDLMTGYVRCPYDIDPSYPVGFRIGYTADVSGAAATEWILLQNALARGGVVAVATTALNTVIGNTLYIDTAGVNSSTDWLWQLSNRGIRTLIGLTRDQIEEGAFLTFSLELQAVTATTATYLAGIEMDYVPMKTQGVGSHIDKPLKTSGVS